jgi:hypothetical protein
LLAKELGDGGVVVGKCGHVALEGGMEGGGGEGIVAEAGVPQIRGFRRGRGLSVGRWLGMGLEWIGVLFLC